ncbi:hypothetical protein [Gordoniibacillus kamchatkensis]
MFQTFRNSIPLTANGAGFDDRSVPLFRGWPSVNNSFRDRGRSLIGSNPFFKFVSALISARSNFGVDGEESRAANDTVFPSQISFNKVPAGQLNRSFVHDFIVYDLEVEGAHSFIAGGIIVHNCQEHHTGVDHEDGGSAEGIHYLPFPEWIMQKLAIPGANPVPQKGETFEQAIERVKAHERKDEINAIS